ncbi:MAG: GNAT family N-acetyltransferase [Actinomycetota bacterium]|nr:GNAT family N-acetyltransferase [Actinomycetota bacterium]
MSVGIRIRRARAGDVDFLVELLNHAEVEPFLAVVRAKDRESLLEEIERSERGPQEFGRILIEVEQGSDLLRAGLMGYEVRNRRSRIVALGNLAVHPDFRGRHVADEAARLLQRYLLDDLDYHRLELEIYGFNERAQRHAERAGFVHEGTRRKAYLRNDEWVDGVMYGLVREDLES